MTELEKAGRRPERGEIRTDEDLLAVVRKHAAGIHFCFQKELEKRPHLAGGRIVARITVAPSGAVTEARIVEDAVGSEAMAGCALSRIRAWRFPAVPEGTVTFQTPFVLTPRK